MALRENSAMTVRPRRSLLYMPGSNARAIEKGRTLAADGLILDLEDAVAPDAKGSARRQVRDRETLNCLSKIRLACVERQT